AVARQLVDRQRAAADLVRHRADRDLVRRLDGALHDRPKAQRLRADRALGPRQPSERRQALGEPLRRAIQPEHRLERGERQLVDAQRALQRMALQLSYELGAADDETRLRAAQEFVATET